MIFSYEVVTYKSINVDFQDLFDYAIKELQEDFDILDIYGLNYYILDNIDFILKELYPCDDLDSELNDYQLDELSDAWDVWLNEKFAGHDFEELVKDLI